MPARHRSRLQQRHRRSSVTDSEQSSTRGVNTLALGGLVLLAAVLLALSLTRLQLTFDLGYFLPAPQDEKQQLLIERLGQGPGTQLVFVSLPGASEAKAETAATLLRELDGIARVLPEERSLDVDELPDVLFRHRLLLGDLPMTEEDWIELLEERLSDVMLADEALQTLIAQDPALLSLNAIETATKLVSAPRFVQSADSTNNQEAGRFLLLQTNTGAFDLDKQAVTVKNIRSRLSQLDLFHSKLYGSGVYGVDLQSSVQRESVLFTGMACIALAALVYFRFRRWSLVLATGMPLIVGGLAGLTALALLFTNIHGITLAFGFTLLGVAIDYPLHLISHTAHASTSDNVWPTLRLGIASTLAAYLAFAFSGTAGMQQLGVFAFTGITVAALSSWVLTRRTNATEESSPTTSTQIVGSPNHLPWSLCLLLGIPLLYSTSLFSDDLSRMTPIPQATLTEDARIRKAMGVADLRHVVSVRSTTLQGVLNQLEKTEVILEQAVTRGDITGYQTVSTLLPSDTQQNSRRKTAQILLESGVVESALEQTDFAPSAFADFQAALTNLARGQTPNLSIAELHNSSEEISKLVDSMLYESNDQWVALAFLRGVPQFTNRFEEALGTVDGVALVDLRQASMSLVADYRSRVFWLLGLALSAITVLLLATTRQPARVIWLLGTLLAAVVVSIGIGRMLLGGLSLFDVIALALVAGLGLDYALFFSKYSNGSAEQRLTHQAVNLCALSSLFVFGVLALSSIPLLRGLGITVASGVAAAWLLARFGWRQPPANLN